MKNANVLRYRILVTLGLISLSMSAQLGFAVERNPVGERSEYLLDRNSSRTSSLIQEGAIATYITQSLPEHQDGPSYEARLDYDILVRFAGRQRGNYTIALPTAYFTPEFFAQLRVAGHYESSKFKMHHLGFADATTMDGRFYERCDKIRIYDIQDPEELPLALVAVQMLQSVVGDLPIDDLELVAHIKEGEPVLGAVKLDLTATYSGLPIKAGADYQHP